MKRVFPIVAVIGLFASVAAAQSADWQGVEKALGRKGAVQEDMFKATFPRTDLAVKVGDVPVEAGLALTSWIGFRSMQKDVMMMGDLALLEWEVAPVMTKLVNEGVQVTALHNHLIGTVPFVMYLHFSAQGDPEKLAGAMRAALALTGTPMGPQASPASQATPRDWTKVEGILGKTGQKHDNLFQVGFPRKNKIVEKGMDIPPYLGMATGINLQAVGTQAATTGDFVLVAEEVNPVVKALIGHGISVTAVHSHMLYESPRLFFLHFWGYGDPEKLATGLKAAIEKTDSVK